MWRGPNPRICVHSTSRTVAFCNAANKHTGNAGDRPDEARRFSSGLELRRAAGVGVTHAGSVRVAAGVAALSTPVRFDPAIANVA